MKNIVILLLIFFSVTDAAAQDGRCKVLLPEISESYTGRCRRGLAHGRGTAEGIDHYQGQFRHGLPHGRGVYTWADGSYYEGQWNEGLREGKGKMVSQDSIVEGYWKAGEYAGEELIAAYRVIQVRSVTRYTIIKSSDTGNNIRIRFMQGGSPNETIEDLTLFYDSGSQYVSGPVTGIESVNFPVNVKVNYRSSNQLRTSQFNVSFEFVVNEPGTWDVTITN
jgi:hypothetical protein